MVASGKSGGKPRSISQWRGDLMKVIQCHTASGMAYEIEKRDPFQRYTGAIKRAQIVFFHNRMDRVVATWSKI
jgi:hypothetical protein